jgi:hypothetical protein
VVTIVSNLAVALGSVAKTSFLTSTEKLYQLLNDIGASGSQTVATSRPRRFVRSSVRGSAKYRVRWVRGFNPVPSSLRSKRLKAIFKRRKRYRK